MKKTILSLILLTVGILSMKADNITVGGLNRSYNVYAPRNLGENRPLLIFCHGYNQDANWMQNSEFKNDNVSMEAVCDTAKFVVVFPNGIDKAWDTGGDRDINFIKAIIEKMVTQYKIDRNRIYLGGFSMGGMLTYNAINKMADQMAEMEKIQEEIEANKKAYEGALKALFDKKQFRAYQKEQRQKATEQRRRMESMFMGGGFGGPGGGFGGPGGF